MTFKLFLYSSIKRKRITSAVAYPPFWLSRAVPEMEEPLPPCGTGVLSSQLNYWQINIIFEFLKVN